MDSNPYGWCEKDDHDFFFNEPSQEDTTLGYRTVVSCQKCSFRLLLTNVMTSEQREWINRALAKHNGEK
jgi:hypothetical protein